MRELFDEIMDVIVEHRINAIYYIDGVFYTRDEVEQIQMELMRKYVDGLAKYTSVALYGGGGYCRRIFDALSGLHGKVTCIIDNSVIGTSIMKGIPVVSIDEFLLAEEKDVDAVIITSWNYHEAFKSELNLVKFEGEVIDIPEWMMEQFPDFKRPIYEYGDRLSYLQINELEMLYRHTEGTEKYVLLKKIIYALFIIKDFLYAEKYIDEMAQFFSEFGESADYCRAICKVKEVLRLCAQTEGREVLFIHVVDSLADYVVDDMPWLSAQAQKGIRFRNITVQYPYTYYAMNTMFTGKNVFDIEKTTWNIDWEDSALLGFIKENYSINVVSGVQRVVEEFEAVNDNKTKYPYITLSETLFEGLALWKKRNYKNVILLCSVGEVHSPFLRTGANSRLVLCKDMVKNAQFEHQFKEAVHYTDEELEWYDGFYHLTKMPMITMGDHGVCIGAEVHYFLGCKKDVTRGMKELLIPALIINGMEGKPKEVKGLVPGTRISEIIMAVLEDKADLLDDLCVDVTELQFSPGYAEDYCTNFMSRGIWGQYEGFIGIRTMDEIYLVSGSGKELYFRPDEWAYRNLAKDTRFTVGLKKCREKLGDSVFPIEIYGMEKFRKHLELLAVYDNDCWQSIMAGLACLR